jgi:hypothetical protein
LHCQIQQDPTKEPTREIQQPTQGSKAQPFYTFEFNDMIWMTNNKMPIDQKPTMDDISTTKSPLRNSFYQPEQRKSQHPSGKLSP